MKFYIATRLERADHHRRVARQLRRLGHELTYDWTEHGSVQSRPPEAIGLVAQAELTGVMRADFVVVLLPGGRGTHAELGMSLAFGKKVFVHASERGGFFARDARTCAFYHHPLVTPIEGRLDEIRRLVQAWTTVLARAA